MTLTYLKRAAVLIAALAFTSCGGCDDGGGNNATDSGINPTDVSDVSDVEEDTISCTPNEILRCTAENTPGVERCNAQGNGVEQSSCGDSQVCREGACVDVTCVPGTRRCADPGQPQECNDEGSAWENIEACTDGDICEEGFCLNRCEIADRTNSYIGCEYWAVELENHLLNDSRDDGEPLPDDQRPPFAIVLANTSDSYDAEVTVYTEEGQLAQAVGSRTVASDVSLPGIDYVTVHSELIDADGNRLQGPISGDIDKLPLPKGTLMTLVLPHRSVEFGKSTLDSLAYRVESTQPVVAYQFNPLCCNYNYTNDASLLLPTSALTENYMFMSYAVWNGSQSRLDQPYSSTMTVLATEPDTQVSIQLVAPKGAGSGENGLRPYSELIYPFDSSRVNGPDANGRINVTMQPFEVLNVAGAGVDPVEDLTGSLIEADKPIAVFGGHTCAFVPFNLSACDHLESQLFPLETWGRRFIAAPLKLRQEDASNSREGTYWKFLAREDGTRIDVGIDIQRPNVLPPADEGVKSCEEFATNAEAGIFELDAGQTCEFGSRDLIVAEASQPIMLGAFLSGQSSVSENADWGSHAGDPAYYLVPPEEQYRRDYSFLTPATYFQSYVTVTTQPGVPVTLDGEPINLSDYDYEENLTRGVARAHIPVEPGPHRIEAQVPFGIVVYGYDDYVSYAYTGGLNFKKLTPWN
ncbi:hypothetical protein FIV42_19990 [Persicimonas caeni]|uniref:IgGFc-binding protein N-terminal domain-containing protein n=1 Tax=Persicimonas caeni TaxID=2292766 RepID=A0A4Y6PXI2_PERCE|nr:IgGFc-binding protein [Persicimonas caeni]QDG52940.1 hypothetical protein FIV42_19990 [Persicimonas caeni]QED34162.1 hypothetical protein FRD00_19985 [Persicimonas caeni]